ncbi:hypothetical protein HZS_2388 [Henneguya salminicola]|nr:hypothetical protein HZS_2388 [Henneguya salminicola]
MLNCQFHREMNSKNSDMHIYNYSYIENDNNQTNNTLYFEVELNKRLLLLILIAVNNSLGLSIAISEYSFANDTFLFVKDVIPNGSAFRNGHIKKGDKIDKLNGESVHNWKLSDFCAKIKLSSNKVRLGIIRLKADNPIDDSLDIYFDHSEILFTKYQFKMPLGFIIDDVGLLIDICCGSDEKGSKPNIFVLVGAISKNSLFPMMESSIPTPGHVIHSLMGIAVQNIEENLIIQKIKEAYEKLRDDGYFEIEVNIYPHCYKNILHILDACQPSFFIPDNLYDSDLSDSPFSSIAESKNPVFLLPPYSITGQNKNSPDTKKTLSTDQKTFTEDDVFYTETDESKKHTSLSMDLMKSKNLTAQSIKGKVEIDNDDKSNKQNLSIIKENCVFQQS